MKHLYYSPSSLFQIPGEEPKYIISSIDIDNVWGRIHVKVIQDFSKVKTFTLTIQTAQEIGFINMQALEPFMK
jgi:hypothetical protein